MVVTIDECGKPKVEAEDGGNRNVLIVCLWVVMLIIRYIEKIDGL